AVLLVIAGTYLLFTSGSIFILKALKKNKKLYYRPNAFISISGMLYRMKQNAVGLANICILATMVIVAVSTTGAIYAGSEKTSIVRYPHENHITLYEPEKLPEVKEQIKTEANQYNVTMKNLESYRYLSLFGKVENSRFQVNGPDEFKAGGQLPVSLVMVPYEDYAGMTNNPVKMAPNELLLYHSEGKIEGNTFTIEDKVFDVKKLEEKFTDQPTFSETYLAVLPPEQ